MNSKIQLSRSGRFGNNRRGFALVLVLGALVLISILILSFYTTVISNQSSTAAYANSGSARNLSEDVIQLVMGQITDATTKPVDINGTTYTYPSKLFAWASQPGMIRTYDTTGKGLMFYKLYSSDSMRTVWDTGTYPPTSMAHDLLQSDMADPAQFTDLNSPVNDSAGNAVYPIADPSSLPTGTNPVQGFSVTGAPATVAGDAATNPIPMPVRWLYVLQNGTLVAAPSGGTSGTVNLAASGASATNPIVGRVSFWTDDETSKVNINTAAEGTYWDTPRFWGSDWPSGPGGTPPPTLTGSPSYSDPYKYPELAYAVSQPAQYEFQRYPGHPAQVALSPIFPKLLTQYSTPQTLAQAMASITPFLAIGGSEGGTLTIDSPANLVNGVLNLTTTNRKSTYATVDEFLYGTATGSPRPLTDSTQNIISPTTLQASKFFITANSRAPELNLFGMPRIACWPINVNLTTNPQSPYTSIYDRLIAFCSSLKATDTSSSVPYYFQRSLPNPVAAGQNDYNNINRNQQLYSYLQNLTGQAIPGFGGGTTGFLSKYPGNGTTTDRDQILTEIFDYIRCTDLLDPNLSSNSYDFASPDNGDTGGNVYPVTPTQIGNTMGFGRTMVITQAGLCVICMIDGSQVSYTNPASPTQGGFVIPDYGPIMTALGLPATTQLAKNQKVLQAAFVMQGFDPSYGNPVMKHNYYISISGQGGTGSPGLEKLTISGATPTNPFNISTYPIASQLFNITYYGIQRGEIVSPSIIANPGAPNYFMSPSTYAYTTPTPSSPTGPFYPYVSKPFLVTGSGTAPPTSLTLSSTPLKINLYVGPVTNNRLNPPTAQLVNSAATASTPYQVLSFTLPGGANFPVPNLAVYGAPTAWAFANRIPGTGISWFSFYPNNGQQSQHLWGDDDVVQTVSLAGHGDWRLLAVNPNVNVPVSSLYQLPNYGLSTDMHSHHMFIELGYMPVGNPPPSGSPMLNFCSSSLIPNLPTGLSQQNILWNNVYPADAEGFHGPGTPWIGDPPGSGTSKAQTANASTTGSQYCYENGDFDNFISDESDGAGINKPDEGDTNANATPYMLEYQAQNVTRGKTFFTPNRIMPSPGMFGSLSTGIYGSVPNSSNTGPTPWQTLLFRPQPIVNGSSTVTNGKGTYYAHTAAAQPAIQLAYNQYTIPPDHLFMDLFWMPIVEPYAISDNFSTAGKINMNYQIQPFTYIDRNTALVCLLKPEKIIAVPDAAVPYYKSSYPPTSPTNAATASVFRFDINSNEALNLPAGNAFNSAPGSLRQFESRFNAGDIFRSATEICDIFLTPYNDENGLTGGWQTDRQAAQWWAIHRLTGDNSRERPYTNLYAHLTTKSNTFTIHMRVQSLKQSPASRAAGIWVNGQDAIVSEYRGSSLIERYLDPSGTYNDYAANTNVANLDSSYKFRVVRNTQFAP